MSIELYIGVKYRVGLQCSLCKNKHWIEVKRLYEDVIKNLHEQECICKGFTKGTDYVTVSDLIRIERTGNEEVLIKDGLPMKDIKEEGLNDGAIQSSL